jgi:hypothetical protein
MLEIKEDSNIDPPIESVIPRFKIDDKPLDINSLKPKPAGKAGSSLDFGSVYIWMKARQAKGMIA